MKTLINSRINFDYLKFNFKKYKGLLLFYTILLMTSFPIPTLIRWIQTRDQQNFENYSNASVYVPIIITIFLSIVTPMILFNYLSSKKSVDVFHSLPIKRSDLFLTNYVASLLIIFIPFTIAYFSGYALNNLLFNISLKWYHIETYFQLLAIFFATTTPVMFVLMNTGTLSDALIYTVIIFIAPFLAFGALELFASTFVIGYTSMRMDSLAFLSPPISVLFGLKTTNSPYDMGLYASYWLILGLILLSVSLVIHDARKSEKSETPFINNWFFPLIIYLFTGIVLIFLLPIFAMGTRTLTVGSVVMPILIALLLFTLLNIIKNRSLKNMTGILKNYTIFAVVLMIFCTILYVTNGLGYTYYIPKIDKIESVTITSQGEFSGIEDEDFLINAGNYLFQKNLHITREQPELLQLTNTFHYSIVSQLKENEGLVSSNLEYTSEYTPIYIEYKLKSGSKIKRRFNVKDELLKPLYPAVVNPDTLKDTNILFNEEKQINQIYIFNNTLTKGYRFTGSRSELIETYKDDLQNAELQPNGDTLNFVLAYKLKDRDYMNDYLLNIDNRHPKTTEYIKNNLKPIDNINTEGIIYRAENEDSVFAKGISASSSIYVSDSVSNHDSDFVSSSELELLKDKVSSFVISDRPHDIYRVNVEVTDLNIYFEYYLSVKKDS
ncbi:ABC transporter permease [Erysipelothrix rhusiopathiae]|uniref:ABC transporter permease n=1 Tax=Erysipelothrix sp. strain 2 (EsS2-7-Brazil) TaxID=2500579 RepID=UPI00137753DB|nr:ABC transporter permease [Erysipelothrix sp. strain 2 (EsS2-7-Brazil)]MBK2404633.1 ABC transporter permease [Erysipelothrix sp. strain 2 (EsS2-7-Brazil)]NBA01236.1 ABC transporter permease [Erysipelothrix rhusiopathiae]